jgi:hypothetical protein
MHRDPDDYILIDFERSGGFTGIPVKVILSDQLLSKDELMEIHRLIDSSDFVRLKEEDVTDNPKPDQFLYKITVETPFYRHSLVIYEQQITPDLRPLIRFLSGKAIRYKK